MQEFAKHVARPAMPQNTGGLMTPRRFLAITQTGQSIKLVPMGTLPQKQSTFVGPGPCRRIGRRLFISVPSVGYRKVSHDAWHQVLEVSDSRVARSSLFCTVAPAVFRVFAPPPDAVHVDPVQRPGID